METVEPSDLRCPACGGALGGFGPEDACMGVRCRACDWAVGRRGARDRFSPPRLPAWPVFLDGGEDPGTARTSWRNGT